MSRRLCSLFAPARTVRRPEPTSRPRLSLQPLEARDVPAVATEPVVVVAADAGAPPEVRLIDPNTQAVRSQFLAYDGGFLGGVRVAVGDVTGDQIPDLVTGAGPGGGPNVRVFDGATGVRLLDLRTSGDTAGPRDRVVGYGAFAVA